MDVETNIFVQNRLEDWLFVSVSLCRVTVESPASLISRAKLVIAVTIATRPKSLGVNSLASIRVAAVVKMYLIACPKIEIAAPLVERSFRLVFFGRVFSILCASWMKRSAFLLFK